MKPVLAVQRVRLALVVTLVKIQVVETVIAMTVRMRTPAHKIVPEALLVAVMVIAMTVRMKIRVHKTVPEVLLVAETVIAMTVRMRRRVHKTVPERLLAAAMGLAMTVRMRTPAHKIVPENANLERRVARTDYWRGVYQRVGIQSLWRVQRIPVARRMVMRLHARLLILVKISHARHVPLVLCQ